MNRVYLPIPLLLMCLLPVPALGNSVTMNRAQWLALQPPDTPTPTPAPGAFVATRAVRVVKVEDGLALHVKWELRQFEAGWFDATLVSGAAHLRALSWNGTPLGSKAESGVVKIAKWVDGDAVIEMVVDLPGQPGRSPIAVQLMPAVAGTVSVDVPGMRGLVVADGLVVGDGVFYSGAERFTIGLAEPKTAQKKGTLAIAHAGVGLTVGDAEVRGKAHLQWEVRRGSLDAVSFSVGGVGNDLDVVGTNVGSWRRNGDTVTVQLLQPATARVDVAVSWSTAVPAGVEASVSLPKVGATGVWRTDSSIQLARDGDLEVVPDLNGWKAIPAAALPEWGEGLVEGTPTAAFERSGSISGGALRLLRLELVEQPPVVIDVAAYTIAMTQHGRSLARVHYEVRNERASHLRFSAPPGGTIVGVRVGGETIVPVTDDRGGWLIPLERSVETVEGMLTFPVEVTWLGDDPDWDKREEREILLPQLSAPVAVNRVTLYLPPGYKNGIATGDGGTVGSFTEGEGIAYGFKVGDERAAEADALFQSAVADWMDNSFDDAQSKLDELVSLGASNDNVSRLQSNLSMLESDKKGGKASVVERRVKEQARARSEKDERKAEAYKKKAEEKRQSGDYAGSSALYSAALDIGNKLAKLEQNEAVELSSKNAELEQSLAELEQEFANQIVVTQSDDNEKLRTLEEEVASLKDKVFRSDTTLELLKEMVVEDISVDLPMEQERGQQIAQGLDWNQPSNGDVTIVDASGAFGLGGLGAGSTSINEPHSQVTIDFDGIEITGELVSPNGAYFGSVQNENGRAHDALESLQDADGWGTVSGGVETGVLYGAAGGVAASSSNTNGIVTGRAGADGAEAAAEYEAGYFEYGADDDEDGEIYFGDDEAGEYFDEPVEVIRSVPGVTVSRGAPKRKPAKAPRSGPGNSAMPKAEPEPEPASRRVIKFVQPKSPPPIFGGAKRGRDSVSADQAAMPVTVADQKQVLAALPQPKVTASALSVVIPTYGDAVLYQQLLIPVDSAPVLVLSAKLVRKK